MFNSKIWQNLGVTTNFQVCIASVSCQAHATSNSPRGIKISWVDDIIATPVFTLYDVCFLLNRSNNIEAFTNDLVVICTSISTVLELLESGFGF